MTKTISVRLDESSERALNLLESQGLDRSEAIRDAIRRAALWAEAERIGSDPEDRKEIAEIQALMDEISAPWPPD